MPKDRSYSTALHILTNLAYHHPRWIRSEDLARGLKTNPALVRRMLCKLSRRGLVESTKGKTGGNRLARPARTIDLGEVYLAVYSGPIFGTFDKEPYRGCKVSCCIGTVLKGIYDDFEKDLVKRMRKVKLSQILKEVK